MNILAQVLGAIGIFAFGIVIHELGHYLKSKELGYLSRLGFSKKGYFYTEFPDNAKVEDKLSIYNAGIVAGFCTIFAFSFLIPIHWMPIIFIMYFIGIQDDLNQIKLLKTSSKK